MELKLIYTNDLGFTVCLGVGVSPRELVSADEAELSKSEAANLAKSAFDRSLSGLSALLPAIAVQAKTILQDSYATSLQNWIKENSPPLDTPLATAVAGEHRRP